MTARKKSKATEVGEGVGYIATQFLGALITMFAFHLLHRDAHAVPALGYWSVFWSIVAINWTGVGIGNAVSRQARRGRSTG